jgi:hypothetical protein
VGGYVGGAGSSEGSDRGRSVRMFPTLQMTEARDRHGEAWEHVDTIGRGDDLGLDPRRGEEQVDDASRGVVPRRQSHGRQAPGGVLLD